MSKKAAIFLADGFEEIEATTVINVLRRAEVDIVVLSVGKELLVKGSRGISLLADKLLQSMDEASLLGCDLFILPGGLQGTMTLAADDRVKEYLLRACEQNKLVAAICAAPYVLGNAGILDNHSYTCYPGMQEKINCGRYTDKSKVVQDGNIVTSKGPGTAMDFALYLAELLCGKNTYENLKEEMIIY